MAVSNIHSGLRTETLGNASGGGVDFTLTKITHGKESYAFGLHANPTSFSISGGVTRSDFLGWMRLREQTCVFNQSGGQCFCVEVGAEFDLAAFASAFNDGFAAITAADRELQQCGFYLESRDFPAKRWVDRSGDGHSGAEHKRMKESEDAYFRFVLTWLVQGQQGGWTTHYFPKEQPLSNEMEAAFAFMGLKPFAECIELDFETCHWRRLIREANGRSVFDANNEQVYDWYNHHAEHFSPGIEHLLAADAAVHQFGMGFIPRPKRPPSPTPPAVRSTVGAAASPQAVADETFDVAISFAGPQRPLAEQLANILTKRGYRVFYDDFYKSRLWGKNLTEFFDRIYRTQSRYCVMFLSQEHHDRIWTTHERRSALARGLESKGKEYILPVIVEQVDIDGLPPTVGYMSIAEHSIEEIAETLCKKLDEE